MKRFPPPHPEDVDQIATLQTLRVTQFLDQVGARLRAARLKAGITIDTLSRLTGLPGSDLSTLENNRLVIRVAHLKRIADALGINPREFLEFEQELPEILQPALDPYYIVDRKERELLDVFRDLVGKEKRIVMVLANGIITTRDIRYEPRARQRKVLWKRDRHAHLLGTAAPRTSGVNGQRGLALTAEDARAMGPAVPDPDPEA